ncbi:hypothetical protein HZB97_01790 [Candidatus Gottesmanbacteria bacterium]|nr:hypothetical protein [Candidatus Gottesmanbacteria bacterium]
MSSKQTLFLSVFTFLTVFAWIAFDVYHAATTSTITSVQQQLIKPLEPRFDKEVILRLKGGE